MKFVLRRWKKQRLKLTAVGDVVAVHLGVRHVVLAGKVDSGRSGRVFDGERTRQPKGEWFGT